MLNHRLGSIEKAVLLFIFVMVLAGFVLLYLNPLFFVNSYTVEDGLVEWLTVAGLLLGSAVCFYRGILFFKHKKALFLLTCFGLGLILFLAAGEEISWGQRIFGIETPEYFQKNNLQKETNFHNLVINGVRINRIIFSFLLIGVLAIYLVIIPVLYQRNKGVRNFINYCGVPLPQSYQVLAFLVLFGATSLMPHEKRAELLECGTGFLLFLIIYKPANKAVFGLKTMPEEIQ